MPRYFTPAEVEGLDPAFVGRLDLARDIAKVPFVITSGRRTPDENANAGGVPDSSHETGHGVDLRCRDSRTRFRILAGLVLAGFRRIGIYDRHIHVDDDSSKPSDVAWIGTSN